MSKTSGFFCVLNLDDGGLLIAYGRRESFHAEQRREIISEISQICILHKHPSQLRLSFLSCQL